MSQAAEIVYTIVTTCIKIVCIVTGSFFGVLGVAIAFAVAPAISWPLSLFWLSRITPMPTRQLYAGASRILITAAAAAAAAWGASQLVTTHDAVAMLAVGVIAGLAAASLFLLVPLYRTDARKLIQFGRLMVSRSEPARSPDGDRHPAVRT